MEIVKSQIKLIFSVFSDSFNPIEFTETIGIEPSKVWQKGDLIPNRNGIVRKECSWEFAIGYVTAFFFDELSSIFLEKFEKKMDIIQEYVFKNQLCVKFDIVAKIGNQEMPSIYLDKSFLKIINKLDAVIDIDMYR